MLAAIALTAFAVAGSAWIAATALRDHRIALGERARLLDSLVGLFPDARLALGPDGYPSLTARLPDRRQIDVELIPDTMVMRRLPQLWLVVTLRERVEVRRPSLGALARSTGAEFYARTHDLPERVDDPLSLESGLLIRGDRALRGPALQRAVASLRAIFADPLMKEAVATARGVRVVRQASEGERGAHLLLRQARFSTVPISAENIRACIAAADVLRAALDGPAGRTEKLSA